MDNDQQEQTSKNESIQIPLEFMRCSLCKHFLSIGPIKRTQDGKTVCGRCPSEMYMFVDDILENALKNVEFPCIFKEYGCKTKLVYNTSKQHEENCVSQPLPCIFENCQFKGVLEGFYLHFLIRHTKLVQNKAIFDINIKLDTKGKILVLKNQKCCFVSYEYNSTTSVLTFECVYFYQRMDSKSCKIHLVNKLRQNNKIQTEIGKYCTYRAWLHNKIRNTLDFGSVMGILNHPETVTVTLFSQVKNDTINYNIIDSYKCSICAYYLIPPIFKFQDKLICKNCNQVHNGDKVSEESKEWILLANQNYPCRWTNCNAIIRGDFIAGHEDACTFRIYECLVLKCEETFTYDAASDHLKTHNIEIVEKFKDKLLLSKNLKEWICIFSYNEIILLNWKVAGESNAIITSIFTSCKDDKFKIELVFLPKSPQVLPQNRSSCTAIPTNCSFIPYILITKNK